MKEEGAHNKPIRKRAAHFVRLRNTVNRKKEIRDGGGGEMEERNTKKQGLRNGETKKEKKEELCTMRIGHVEVQSSRASFTVRNP